MEVNRKSWGQVTIFKNSEVKDKRFDSSRTFSINNSNNQMDIEEIAELFMLLIDKTKTKNFNELKKMLDNKLP